MRSLALAAVLTGVLTLSGHARHTYVLHAVATDRGDAKLVNVWGLAASPTGPWWTANEARETSSVYSGDGRRQLLAVHVDGGPTGVVFHDGPGFVVRGGGHADPARFIYACEDGFIRAWTPTVPDGWSDRAVVAVDDVAAGALFRGLALSGDRLYATDFHNAQVVAWDARWRPVHVGFHDASLPPGYAPFGIVAIGRHVFVTYAFQAPLNGNDAPNGGFVDEYTRDGRLVARLPHGRLNEPWGLALAPRSFGRFGGDLLVGNFGDGTIRAFRREGAGWVYDGKLPVTVNGLWGIAFGNGALAGPRDTLFAAAGPHEWRGPTEQSVGGALSAIRAVG